MIWDRDTVQHVLRMYLEASVSDEVLCYPDSEAAIKANLAFSFAGRALLSGFAVAPGDVVFDLRHDEPLRTTFLARWEPSTREVELVGGSEDGRIVEWGASPWVALRLPVASAEAERYSRSEVDPPPFGVAHTFTVVEYRMSGWDDQRGRWVFHFSPG